MLTKIGLERKEVFARSPHVFLGSLSSFLRAGVRSLKVNGGALACFSVVATARLSSYIILQLVLCAFHVVGIVQFCPLLAFDSQGKVSSTHVKCSRGC